MTKLALKGLLSRKLRSVLTGFAVVIGVAFVVGTLVFTDTIDESFKNLFERTQQGVDVAIEARQAVKSDFSVPPTMPADTLEKVKATPGRRGRRGRRQLRRHAARQAGRADRLQRPADAAGLRVNTEERFQVARLRERRPAEHRRRGRARPRHGQQVRLQGRRHGHGLRHRARPSSSRSRASPRWPARTTSAARGWSCFTLPEAQRMTGHDGYDSISVATGGNNAGRGQGRAAARAGTRLPGPHGRGGGRAAGAGLRRRARLPADRAARVRGRRAARRRLPDLQHVHGHGRAAHEGVRAAARARRLARRRSCARC